MPNIAIKTIHKQNIEKYISMISLACILIRVFEIYPKNMQMLQLSGPTCNQQD